MLLKLQHAPNPDLPGGYWSPELVKDLPYQSFVNVTSLEEASKVCQEYIGKYDLGGGNWPGGLVFSNGLKVARISYNGRIWEE